MSGSRGGRRRMVRRRGRRSMVLRSAAVGAVLLGSVANAQTSTGTLVPGRETSSMVFGSPNRSGTKQPSDTAMEGGRAMARCMAGNHAKEANALLAAANMPAFSASYRQVKRFIASCLSMVEVYGDTVSLSMGFDNNTLRSLLAEARFRRLGVTPLPVIDYDPLAGGSEWISQDPAQQATLQAGDCLVARQPDAVASLLRSIPASVAESSAFSTLMPHLGSCLDRNIRLSMKKIGLRLALASAYDRRERLMAPAMGKR